MKIAYITNRFYPAFGGAERFLALLLRELTKHNDFSATVITSDFLNSSGSQKIASSEPNYFVSQDKVQIKRLPSFRILNRDALTIIPSLGNELKQLGDYDIIHSYTYGYSTSWVPALLKKQLNKKIIFSPLYAPNQVYPKPLTKLYDGTLGKTSIINANKIVLLSETYRAFFERYNNNVLVIPHPIEPIPQTTERERVLTREKYALPANAHVILSLSRLTKSKGIHLLIDGFKKYIQLTSTTTAHLVIAGNGDEFANLNSQVERLGIKDRVTIIQNVSDQERVNLYNIASIFALLSYSGEAFGITQIEAMSLGIPVVGNKHGVAKHLITAEHTGELVDPFSPTEVAHAIIKIIDNKSAYYSRDDQFSPRTIMNKYDPTTVAEQYYDLYADMLKQTN